MINESSFELEDGEFDSQNYKSCFARSVVVNSDFRLKKVSKISDVQKVQLKQSEVLNGAVPKMSDTQGPPALVRMRKVSVKSAIATKIDFLYPFSYLYETGDRFTIVNNKLFISLLLWVLLFCKSEHFLRLHCNR